MRAIPMFLAAFLAAIAQPLAAALPVGAKAPDIWTMGALAGKPFRLHLAEQLRHGPVVLYFFPKAFTEGCTLETKAFADAMPKFRAAGARVVGMSADDLPTRCTITDFARRARRVLAQTRQAVAKVRRQSRVGAWSSAESSRESSVTSSR